ncbi:MAG: ATP-binding cassette domain-containing protein [Deltaproteobacteria bacterium]|nr:ATP-binding cassette domain-containing protein [Deltaproteobacteria bacterium]
MIVLEGVGHRYPGGTQALTDVSLRIAKGETLVLLGRSGSGKSTLLKTMNGLVRPNRGRVDIDGQPLDPPRLVALRRRMGYVVQHAGLFPHLTVAQNIGLVARLTGWPASRIGARVSELLALVALPARSAARYPQRLSGGEQQRVGIARALMLDPDILLMDEPFSALDPITRGQLQDEFARWKAELRKTIVLVTHDVREAFRLGDRIAILEAGRLLQIGAPRELTERPATPHVAALVQGGGG